MNRRTLLQLLALNAMTFPFSLQADKVKKLPYKRLILIELKGGNDGLNTVIPYADPLYYKLRPNIAIEKKAILPLNNKIGFHPSLSGLKEIFDHKELAVIQGVGYPDPNRSHFRSIDIWDTASKSQEYLDTGWLSTLKFSHSGQLKGVILGGDYGPLSGLSKGVIKINNIKGFLQQAKQIRGRISLIGNNASLQHLLEVEQAVRKGSDVLRASLTDDKALSFPFKKSNFHRQMQTATKIINGGSFIPFIKVSLGSFDTHVNQRRKHANLLKELSEGISTMRKNLIQSGQWENTVIMTYSEFGRRAAENANKGTDHGTAAPHFVLGGKVKGGVYGTHPSLSKLDNNKDLIYTTDFHSMYESVAKGCFQTSSTRTKKFTKLNLL